MKMNEKTKGSDSTELTLAALMADGAVFKGHVHIRVFDDKGETLAEYEDHNTVTTQGLYGIADNLLAAPSLGKPTHMAVGTGSPQANALQTESDRIALATKTRDNAEVEMTATWAPGDVTATVTELGIFNDPSAGNMWFSRSQSPGIPLGASVGMTVTWTLTISTS